MKSSTASRVFAALVLVRRSLTVAVFACCVAMLWANVAPASINYNTIGGSYAQNFDSLPITPQNATLGNSPTGWTDDNASPGAGNFSIEGWYLWHPLTLVEGGFSGNQRMRIGAGTQNTGAFMSFGASGNTERALGAVGSNTLGTVNSESYIGLRLTNNTGSTLGQFTLSYNGEQWRDGGAASPLVPVAQNLKFGYKVGAANVQDTGFTLAPALQFTSPVFTNTATGAAVDGNAAGRVAIAATTVSGFNWAPGTDLWLRWIDINDPNNDHGLGIDDVSFSANIIPTSTWTGATNSNWNTASNWTGGVPVSGNIANFDSPGNSNTSISLGGSRPIGFIQFNTGAAAYTLGSSSEQFDVDAGGSITVASGVTSPQTINAKINALGSLNITNSSATAGLTIGSDVTSSSSLAVDSASDVAVNGPVTNNGSMAVSGAGTATFNGVIGGTGPMTSTMTGTLVTNAQHTFAGGSNISVTTSTQPVVRVGASTVGSPGSVTAGPFGTGAFNISGATSPIIQPTGSDITIANNVTLNAGFFANTAPAAVDPTPRSLTFTGPITTVGARVITSNLTGPAQLNLGATGSTLALSRSGTDSLTLQSQLVAGSTIVINHQLSGGGLTTIQNGAIVHMNGIDNNYTGNTNISGTNNPKLFVNGTKTGTGAVNVNVSGASVGTLGGTGSVAGAITNNGIIAPGLPGGAPATLTATGNVTNGANGHWAIELSGATADMLAVGGNIDLSAIDFLDITGTGTGSSWVIATYAGSLTGTFDNITSGYTVDYGLGSNSQITLNAVGAALLGDFNSDGKVDAGDYVTWRKNDGTNNALPNDNGLGTPIRPEHYDLWRANFGNPPGSGSSLDGGAVPEPGTMVLLVVGLMAMACPRSRNR